MATPWPQRERERERKSNETPRSTIYGLALALAQMLCFYDVLFLSMSSPRIRMKLCLKVTFILCTLITSVYSKSSDNFDIRLTGGNSIYEGRLEVYYNREWGTVCNDGWGEDDARVVCRQLGFGEPLLVIINTGYDGDASQRILFDEVYCEGWEPRLSLCSYSAIGNHDCRHNEDVALKCAQDLSVRLADGSTINEGRLEVYYNGEWGTVCDDEWDEDEARVVCRQLGFGEPVLALISTRYSGDASQPILLDDVRCTGSETRLSLCSYSIGEHDCRHFEDVALQCLTDDVEEDFTIRLVDGVSENIGRLEMYFYNEWIQVCSYQWTATNSEIACHQLGYLRADDWPDGYYISNGAGPYLMDFNCYGHEDSLVACSRSKSDDYCYDPVKLQCTDEYVEEDFTIRLVDGVYENVGRLEIYYNGEWSQVCNSQWTDTNSEIVCHQLGYLRADDWPDGYFISNGAGPYRLDFNCYGHEDSLGACSRSKSNDYCYDPVKLQCTNEYYSQGDARLVGSYADDGDNEGIVEVYLYGTWGTICSTYWSYSESETLCRQLGFQTGELVDAYHYDTTVVNHLPIHEVTFDCYGGEYHLSDCNTLDIGYCSHSEDVALTCEKYDTGTGLSGGAIAGITIGSFVGLFCFYACVCWKKRNQEVTNNVATNPPVTSIPLMLHSNRNQVIRAVPSAPPAMTEDLPPAYYDCVVAEPDMYKSPIETPPPAYIGYSSPLNQGADNQAT